MHSDVDIIKKYQSIVDSASSRGLDCNISFSEFKKIYNQRKCYYTGVPLIHGKNFSIDRVDNSKGYISNNLVACDTTFNQLKSNLSIEQIHLLNDKINQFLNSKIKK